MTHAPEVAVAVLLSTGLDWTVREPPERLHPVAWFGGVVAWLDREWTRPLATGAALAAVLPVAAAAVVGGFVALVGSITALVGVDPHAAAVGVAALALFATTSLRSLLETADGVVAAAETDPDAAREQLPSLVGRDPEALDAAHVRSAAVESLAENLSDGLVAPLLGFSVGAILGTWVGTATPVPDPGGGAHALAGGAAAAAWVKAVNTMDSMLGYPDRPVGTGAARLDDAVVWLPARLTALLLTVAAGSPEHVLAARRWAGATASPNAGWPMATTASALGVRLEKPGAYDLDPTAPIPDVGDARRGIRLVGRAGLLAYALAACSGVVAWAS